MTDNHHDHERLDEITYEIKELRRQLQEHKDNENDEKYKNMRAALVAVGGVLLAVVSFFVSRLPWGTN